MQRTIGRWLQGGSNSSTKAQSFDFLLQRALSLARRGVCLRIPSRNAASINKGLQMSCAQAQGNIIVRRTIMVLAPVIWAVLPAVEPCLLVLALLICEKIRTHQTLFITGFQGVKSARAATRSTFGALYHPRKLAVVNAKLAFHVFVNLHLSTVTVSDSPSEKC